MDLEQYHAEDQRRALALSHLRCRPVDGRGKSGVTSAMRTRKRAGAGASARHTGLRVFEVEIDRGAPGV